jgi:hypothetical protein
MSGELLYDIIKIEPSIFKDYYNVVNKNKLNGFLNKKKEEIYSNICFHTTYESYYHGDKKDDESNNRERYTSSHKYNYKHKFSSYKKSHNDYHSFHGHGKSDGSSIGSLMTNNNTHHSYRLYILSTDFTEDSKVKKKLTGYLNKLTKQNTNILYPKIQEILKGCDDILYDIIWDFIKNSPENLYINILKFFDDQKTEKRYEEYVINKKWMPIDIILNNNLLKNDESLYDIYCDYVKWKKEVSNINKAWCLIFKDIQGKHNRILQDLYELFDKYKESKVHKHIVDFSLEQMYMFLKESQNKNIIQKIKEHDLKHFESSSKFLIMNIIELQG